MLIVPDHAFMVGFLRLLLMLTSHYSE
jgi:hypothetical protein